MMRKILCTPKNMEIAYGLYQASGGRDIKLVLERLTSKHGLKISEQTLYAWANKGRWKERMGDGAGNSGVSNLKTCGFV